MPRFSVSLPIGVLVCFSSIVGPELRAESSASGAVQPPALTLDSTKFTAARNDAEVLLSWQLPAGYEVRFAELLRHTGSDAKGRKRVGPVSLSSGRHSDQVPDPAQTYWYWLKITLKDGRTLGVGPIQTPPADVWQPAP